MRTGLWDRQGGQTLQVAAKKCMAWNCFSVEKAKSLDIECRILP